MMGRCRPHQNPAAVTAAGQSRMKSGVAAGFGMDRRPKGMRRNPPATSHYFPSFPMLRSSLPNPPGGGRRPCEVMGRWAKRSFSPPRQDRAGCASRIPRRLSKSGAVAPSPKAQNETAQEYKAWYETRGGTDPFLSKTRPKVDFWTKIEAFRSLTPRKPTDQLAN